MKREQLEAKWDQVKGLAKEETETFFDRYDDRGKVGYLVLWLMGAPAGLLFILWLFLGNNIFGAG